MKRMNDVTDEQESIKRGLETAYKKGLVGRRWDEKTKQFLYWLTEKGTAYVESNFSEEFEK